MTAPGEEHGHAVTEDLATIHMALRPEFVRSVAQGAAGLEGAGHIRFPDPARRATGTLESLLRRMVQEARRQASWRNLLVDTLGTELIIQLVADHGVAVADPAPAEEGDGLTRAIEAILNRFDTDLNLSGLAAEAGMSLYHFLRRFKGRVVKTPNAYLRQIRVEQARLLLESTDLLVTEVALRCGFGGANRLAEALQSAYRATAGQLRARSSRGAAE